MSQLKTLEIKTSLLLNLVLANNTILLCFIFSIIDWYFSIPTIKAQFFNPTTELVPPTKEVKVEIEAPPVTAEAKISKCSI